MSLPTISKQKIYCAKEYWIECSCGYSNIYGGWSEKNKVFNDVITARTKRELKSLFKIGGRKGYWCPSCDKQIFF